VFSPLKRCQSALYTGKARELKSSQLDRADLSRRRVDNRPGWNAATHEIRRSSPGSIRRDSSRTEPVQETRVLLGTTRYSRQRILRRPARAADARRGGQARSDAQSEGFSIAVKTLQIFDACVDPR
jgi:hypothetical protein